MKIGILSDTHNDIQNLQKVMAIFAQHPLKWLIHCGDVTSLETVKLMTEYPIYIAFGNGDLATGTMRDYLKACNAENKADYLIETSLDNKRIGIAHGHLTGEENLPLSSGKYDYFFHGHTHKRVNSLSQSTRVINPGAVVSMSDISSSVCILDLTSGELNFIEI